MEDLSAVNRSVSKSYIPSLDGVRAAGAIFILLSHSVPPIFVHAGDVITVFFVLSGYLITSILFFELKKTSRISIGKFYLRRFLRLGPALLFSTLLFSIFYLIDKGRYPWREVLVGLTYTANWISAFEIMPLGDIQHYWTLAIEEQYYLMWPWVVWGIHQFKGSNRNKGLILAGIATALAIYRGMMVGVYTEARIFFGLDTHMDGLVLGSALCYLVQAYREGDLKLPTGKWLGWFLVPASLIILTAAMIIYPFRDPWTARYGIFLTAVVSAILVADLVIGKHSIIKASLETRAMVYFGKISYGLYLVHLPIFGMVDNYLPKNMFLIGLFIKFALSLAVASFSYHIVETPFLRIKDRI